MEKIKRIGSVIHGLNNFKKRYGWAKLVRKSLDALWRAVRSGDLKWLWKPLHNVATRHAGVLSYAEWIAKYEKTDEFTLAAQRDGVMQLQYRPRFSLVVPTYNTPRQILVQFLDSVMAQTYPDWELCVADDASSLPHVRTVLDEYASRDDRIRVAYRSQNGHISEATNTALELVVGDYVCLMDHDDTIAPNALYEFALKLNESPGLDMIYSDEDKVSYDGTSRFEPFFKPEWSPEYLDCCMYTAHFACYKAELVRKVGGFRSAFNGAQDYDFMLRLSEQCEKIAHVPKILYHWRSMPGSTAASMDNKEYVVTAAVRALEEHAARTGQLEFAKLSFYKGCFHLRYRVQGAPKVSIVIPSAGRNSVIRGKDTDLLANCVSSIMEKSTYKNIELVVVDNNDLRVETISSLSRWPVKFVHYLQPEFNVAAKMNIGAKAATGDYVLFLNDDVEVISEDWLEAMLSVAQRPGVGVVGAKLFFEDGTLQHVGVTFCNGLPDHIRRGYPGDDPGYFFSSEGQRNYLAVTGACLLLKKALFDDVGGFDEALAINYNDIDLCLKVWRKGLRNVYTGQAKLYHFESRNRERTVAKHEQDLFANRWADLVTPDPYYSQYFMAAPPDFEMA